MIVDLPASGPVLLERDDFTALKVAADAGTSLGDAARALGARAVEAEHLWIPAEHFRRLAAGADAAWHASFRAMLDKVEPYGWYDSETRTVKAHLELRS